jgi:hypothetical protein
MKYLNPHGPSCPWFSLAELTGAPNIKWCEETLCQWISEPANTWSNLGYLIVALVIIVHGYKTRPAFEKRLFGFVIFVMGLVSLVYHLSNFYFTQVLDFVGMFLFLSWAIGMNLVRLKKLHIKKLITFMLLFTIFGSVMVDVMYRYHLHFQILILLGAVAIVLTEFISKNRQKIRYHWYFASLFFLLAAFSFSAMDISRFWCDPSQHSWFSQGHALWHWLSAIAMGGVYLHYLQVDLKND